MSTGKEASTLQRLISMGAEHAGSERELRYLRLTTTLPVVMLCWMVCVLAFKAAFLPRSWPLIVTGTAVMVGWATTYWWIRRGALTAARVWFLSTCWLYTVGNSLLLGPDSDNHLFLLPIVVGCFMFFPPSERRWMAIGVAASSAAFAGLELWFVDHGALAQLPASPWMTRATVLATLFLLVAALQFHARRELHRFEDALILERRRSDELLLSILPPAIAEELKDGPKLLASRLDEVTVLFADLVGFTPLSERLDPQAVVEMLDEVVREFDELADVHGLERVKLIGDAYMAVAGAPTPRDDHCEAAARMALDMLAAMKARLSPRFEGLQLRIGLSSGPAVAGVVGRRKFQYDLWSDTVNTASRMESHGVAGRVHVSEDVHRKLAPDFQLEARGTIDVKGKGPMPTWFLCGAKSA